MLKFNSNGIKIKFTDDAIIDSHRHRTGLFIGFSACMKCPRPKDINIRESNIPMYLFSVYICFSSSLLLEEYAVLSAWTLA